MPGAYGTGAYGTEPYGSETPSGHATASASLSASFSGSGSAVVNYIASASLSASFSGTAVSSGAGMEAQTAPGTGGYAVAASTEYTAIASFQAATTGRMCQVGIIWYDATGTQVGSIVGTGVTDNTSTPTQAVCTATSPLTAAFASVFTVVVTSSSGEVHDVTDIDLAPGMNTTWSQGGLAGLTEVILLRSDGLYVRTASIANPYRLPLTTQTQIIEDLEAVPTVAYTYQAQIAVNVGGDLMLSAAATSNSVTLVTTGWWEVDPNNPSSAVSAQAINWEPQVTEQSTAHLVMGQQTPNVVANVMGGLDGQATFETFDPDTYADFQALLTSQSTIWVSSPFGPTDSAYVRFGPQTGGLSSGSGNKVNDSSLLPGTSENMHRTTAVTWVAQARPPV